MVTRYGKNRETVDIFTFGMHRVRQKSCWSVQEREQLPLEKSEIKENENYLIWIVKLERAYLGFFPNVLFLADIFRFVL